MTATTIAAIDARTLDVPLVEPFGIATGAQTLARNVLVRVALAGGAEGFGEAAPFPAVNGETQEQAHRAISAAIPQLVGRDAVGWRGACAGLERLAASARCALETAILDAACVALSVPMWRWFGGASSSLETDVTITTGGPEAAALAASRLAAEGIRVLKVKVGGAALADDLARLARILEAAPGCDLLLDANAALPDPDAAVRLVDEVSALGGRIVLLEQPLARDDLAGLASLSSRITVPIAADESASEPAHVVDVARAGARVVNLKAMKSGLLGAFDMAILARTLGLGLMIGGMVETRLALSASAALAAGLGGFQFVDLDTHRWMKDEPIAGGFADRAGKLDLSAIAAGHGARPR